MRTGRILAITLAGFGMLAAQSDGTGSANIQQSLKAAREAEEARDYARAGTEYERILQLQPDLAVIHQRLGLTYHLRNRFGEASREFSRAIELDSALWGAHLFLGIDLYKANQFQKAIAAIEKSVSLNAQAEPEARFWLGASQAALGRHQNAIREYRRAAELRPKDIEVSYALASEYDLESADVFEQIHRIAPQAGAVALLRAERLLADNRADLASIEYRNAVLVRPDYRGAIASLEKTQGEHSAGSPVSIPDARAILQQAAYWSAHGDAERSRELLHRLAASQPAGEEARQYIQAAQRANAGGPQPSDPGAWPALYEGWRCAQAGEFARAEQVLREVLVKDPGNIDAFLALGKTYKKWTQFLLDKMIEIDPDSYRVHQLLGEQHEKKAEFDQAIQSYQLALAREPGLGGVRYAIGNVYWKMHQFGPAEHWLAEELAHNPHHGLAHYRLGGIYTDSGKPDDAILHLREALTAHPELAGAQLDLGRALLLKALYADAVTALQKVAVEEPANDRVHYFLSNAYRKMGREGEAKAEMEKYQTLTRQRLETVQQEVRDVSRAIEKKE